MSARDLEGAPRTAARARTRTRTRRNTSAGFTLPELLVSMVAGLLVALAVVGLSKEANNTFQEETRIAGAEMQLRTAVDRLRADLQRASFMSTGNILADPQVAHAVGRSNVASVPPGMTLLSSLQGLRLVNGGSTNVPLSTAAGLTPDLLQIAGSFTTTEQLVVTSFGAAGSSNCGGQRIYLDVNSSPSLWRLVGMSTSGLPANYDAALKMAFQPATNAATGGGNPTGQFIVRLGDDTGHFQYLATCPSNAAAWNTGAPYVDVAASPPIMTNEALGALVNLGGGSGAIGGVSGTCGGRCTVNPIQIVRWQIAPSTLGPSDPAKYDLVRQYLDVSGATVGSPEVVAEYAVDLKIGFAVDKNSNGDVTGASSVEAVFPFDDLDGGSGSPQNQAYATDISSPAGKAQFPGPQRVRSVRFRIATRGALPDRSQPMTNDNGYVFRYCIALGADGGPASCTAGSNVWARARTVVGEVALPNQARLFWP